MWWTLTARGKTNKVHGILAPVWEFGTLVYQENRRDLGRQPIRVSLSRAFNRNGRIIPHHGDGRGARLS